MNKSDIAWIGSIEELDRYLHRMGNIVVESIDTIPPTTTHDFMIKLTYHWVEEED